MKPRTCDVAPRGPRIEFVESLEKVAVRPRATVCRSEGRAGEAGVVVVVAEVVGSRPRPTT